MLRLATPSPPAWLGEQGPVALSNVTIYMIYVIIHITPLGWASRGLSLEQIEEQIRGDQKPY
jgi:hypothetical protein